MFRESFWSPAPPRDSLPKPFTFKKPEGNGAAANISLVLVAILATVGIAIALAMVSMPLLGLIESYFTGEPASLPALFPHPYSPFAYMGGGGEESMMVTGGFDSGLNWSCADGENCHLSKVLLAAALGLSALLILLMCLAFFVDKVLSRILGHTIQALTQHQLKRRPSESHIATSVARLDVTCAAPANSSAAARPQRQEASLVASWRKARVARPVVLSASAQVQAAPRVSARSVAVKASAGSADEAGVKYHFVVANATFMLDEEEHFQEQLKERLRWLEEKGTEQNFWLVFEPKFLEEFPEIAKRVKRPAVALVSTDATWITFMKLRLDRVLKGEFEASSQDDALEGKPFDISFPKPANWVAPYPKYEPNWWKPYAPAKYAKAN
ncbi:unnamed protein product [Closterium sp. NIES-65]|nr:unnamed protein product [Closterium sp. NIES-65]